VNTKVGGEDPKFREKITGMLDATIPYSRVIMPSQKRIQSVNWEWQGTFPGLKPYIVLTNVEGTPYLLSLIGAMNSVALPDLAEARSMAKLAFLSKIREHQSPWSTPTFLGELKETVSMVRHPLRSILRETRNYRSRAGLLARALRSKPGRLADKLEKAYLQWTYGVAPLIGDFDSAVEAIQGLFKDRVVTRISASSPTFETKVSGNSSAQFEENGWAMIMRSQQVLASYKVRLVGAMKSEADGPSLTKFRDKFSLRAKDFVPTIYELIPGSFLLDYFSTTGSALNGFFTSFENLVYVCETRRSHVLGILVLVGLPGNNAIRWPTIPSLCKLEKLAFNRDKASLAVGFNDLRIQMPNSGQWFNTFVLGMQKCRSVQNR
jgi:hypothetical protein